MSADGISIDTSSIDVVKRNFMRMRDRAKNPKTVMEIIAVKAWRGVVNGNFREEKDDDGQKWAPLQRPRSGRRHKGSSKLLQDTGFLRNSIRFRSKIDEAEVYTRCKYARTHNQGDTKRNIPKRQFMYVEDGAKMQIMRTLGRYITDGDISIG